MNKNMHKNLKTKFDKNRYYKISEKNERIKLNEEIGKISEIGEAEDTTKYGEFVSSYFAWLTLDRQKKTARRLENITKDITKNK